MMDARDVTESFIRDYDSAGLFHAPDELRKMIKNSPNYNWERDEDKARARELAIVILSVYQDEENGGEGFKDKDGRVIKGFMQTVDDKLYNNAQDILSPTQHIDDDEYNETIGEERIPNEYKGMYPDAGIIPDRKTYTPLETREQSLWSKLKGYFSRN